jgi:hypothetical protein
MKHLVPSPLFDVATWQRAHSGTKIEDGAHLTCERYHANGSESRHGSGGKSTHSAAVIITLEGNAVSIENRHFVGNDAVDVVPDGSERTQQALAGAYSPGAPCGAAMSVVASEAC